MDGSNISAFTNFKKVVVCSLSVANLKDQQHHFRSYPDEMSLTCLPVHPQSSRQSMMDFPTPDSDIADGPRKTCPLLQKTRSLQTSQGHTFPVDYNMWLSVAFILDVILWGHYCWLQGHEDVVHKPSLKKTCKCNISFVSIKAHTLYNISKYNGLFGVTL